MKLPQTPDERLARMRENILRFGHLPPLPTGEPRNERLSLYGYGPSLADTWQAPRGVVVTCSGAHRFLLDRGVKVDYHVEIDPRWHKVEFVRESHPDVTYLLSSTCHPEMFEVLLSAGRRVHIWHGYTDDDVAREIALLRELCPPGKDRLLAGGTNAGLRAMTVALELGFRRFELHGIDCSYRGGAMWAGSHHDSPQDFVKVTVGGREFQTSEVMLHAIEDFWAHYAFIEHAVSLSARRFTRLVKIHGDGLLAAVFADFFTQKMKGAA